MLNKLVSTTLITTTNTPCHSCPTESAKEVTLKHYSWWLYYIKQLYEYTENINDTA